MGSRRDEHGAVAVLTAGLMVIVLAFGAFAVDIGTQRVARRDMQALADVVALDAARLLDGRTATAVRAGGGALPSLASAVDRSRRRNDAHVVGEPADLRVRAYLVTLGPDGTYPRTSTGLPQEVTGTAVPRAVVVVADTRVDFGFGQVVGVSSGGAERASVATRAVPSVCFSVGTKALALDSTQSVLSPVLDRILRVNLSAIGYDGLVGLKNASVPLAGLLAQLGVGTVDQLATTNVSLGRFLLAAADAASANGDAASARVLKAVQLGVPGSTVNLARILALQAGANAAGVTSAINLLDIVTAAVVAANGTNAIAVSVPGLTDLTIIEPPRIACGSRGATASSAQVRLHLKPTLVGDLGLGLLGGSTDLTVDVASGTATIDADLSCAPEAVTLTVVSGGAVVAPPVAPAFGQVNLTVTLARFLSFLGPLNLVTNIALSALGIDRVLLDVLVTGSVASTRQTSTITFPPAPALPPKLVVPTSGLGTALTLNAVGVRLTPGQSNSLLGLLTPLLNASLGLVLNGLVAPIVNSVVSPAVSAIVNPVLAALGVRAGVAEVSMLGRPVCDGTRLVG